MFSYLDTVAKQIIILRRHFWYTRDIINFLIHTQTDKEDEIKYLHMAYDDTNQLIELIESSRGYNKFNTRFVYCKCFSTVK